MEMQSDKQVVFNLVLWVIITIIIVFGVLFLITDVDAAQEKFTVTMKFDNLTIQQVADLDKWIKTKYPESVLSIENTTPYQGHLHFTPDDWKVPNDFKWDTDSILFVPCKTRIDSINVKVINGDSTHWYKYDSIYRMNVNPLKSNF